MTNTISRRSLLSTLAFLPTLFVGRSNDVHAGEMTDHELGARFKYLSEIENSNCPITFMNSIASMAPEARLQGSCCAPMDAHRYKDQILALKKYNTIAYVPPDPYDISAQLARMLIAYDDRVLNGIQQAVYDYALTNADEKGPCCCQCWRWHVYGGLGKHLIRKEGFDGPRLVEVWNLSSGCGGGAKHLHE